MQNRLQFRCDRVLDREDADFILGGSRLHIDLQQQASHLGEVARRCLDNQRIGPIIRDHLHPRCQLRVGCRIRGAGRAGPGPRIVEETLDDGLRVVGRGIHQPEYSQLIVRIERLIEFGDQFLDARQGLWPADQQEHIGLPEGIKADLSLARRKHFVVEILEHRLDRDSIDMLQRIEFDLRLRFGALLLDLFDDFENALHIPLAPFDDHQSHFRNERDIDIADQTGAAAERIRRPHSHAWRIVVLRILCIANPRAAGRLLVLHRLLEGGQANKADRFLDPFRSRWSDRNNLRGALRVEGGQVDRGDHLCPRHHLLGRALQADFIVATIDLEQFAGALLSQHL